MTGKNKADFARTFGSIKRLDFCSTNLKALSLISFLNSSPLPSSKTKQLFFGSCFSSLEKTQCFSETTTFPC
ncbi:hypothetical protein ATX17_09810 [Oenococcus oeni]|nr:hypothetical protein ATX17_09810 [Oenococcus oeni]